MSVVFIHQGQGLTQESYEEAVRRLTGSKSRMESPGDWPVEGLLVHITGEGEQGFRIVDVWESEEAAGRFFEVLAPILDEVGIKNDVESYQAHSVVK